MLIWGCIDMFISKTRYQALQAIITDQNDTISTLNSYINMLKTENQALKMCIRVSAVSADDIDFPNSTKGGFEDSDIFTL